MITKRLGLGLALAIALAFLAAAALRYAAANAVISEDVARRAVQVLIGLGLAAWGNLMPKQRGRLGVSVHAEAWSQSALRVGGWAMTLAGLTYAALWAFAPLAFADTASVWVVVGAAAVMVAAAVRALVVCRRSAIV